MLGIPGGSTNKTVSLLAMSGMQAMGTTATAVPAFQNVVEQRGTAITQTTTAVLGTTIFISETGLYSFNAAIRGSSGNVVRIGFYKNCSLANKQSNFTSFSATDPNLFFNTFVSAGADDNSPAVSCVYPLNAGDNVVILLTNNHPVSNGVPLLNRFLITKIGNGS